MTAVLLDVGNTLAFVDTVAIAELARAEGATVTARALASAEGPAKRRYEALIGDGASHEGAWALYFTTLFVEAGIEEDQARSLVVPIRQEHDRLNLWRRVPASVFEALDKARGLGLRLGVISNSEGRLDELFEHVGLSGAFEVVVDSAHEGVRKPDRVIFERALERMGVAAAETLYAGDIPAVDVAGALNAGLKAALIDPMGFYPEHRLSPRFDSVLGLFDAIEAERDAW